MSYLEVIPLTDEDREDGIKIKYSIDQTYGARRYENSSFWQVFKRAGGKVHTSLGGRWTSFEEAVKAVSGFLKSEAAAGKEVETDLVDVTAYKVPKPRKRVLDIKV